MVQISATPQTLLGPTPLPLRLGTLADDQAAFDPPDFIALLAIPGTAAGLPVNDAVEAVSVQPPSSSFAAPVVDLSFGFPSDPVDKSDEAKADPQEKIAMQGTESAITETDFAYFAWAPMVPVPVLLEPRAATEVSSVDSDWQDQIHVNPESLPKTSWADATPEPGLAERSKTALLNGPDAALDIEGMAQLHVVQDNKSTEGAKSEAPDHADVTPPSRPHALTSAPMKPVDSSPSPDMPVQSGLAALNTPKLMDGSALSTDQIKSRPMAETVVQSRRPILHHAMPSPADESLLRSLWPIETADAEVVEQRPRGERPVNHETATAGTPPLAVPLRSFVTDMDATLRPAQEPVPADQLKQDEPAALAEKDHPSPRHELRAEGPSLTPPKEVDLRASNQGQIGSEKGSFIVLPPHHSLASSTPLRADSVPVSTPTPQPVHLQIAHAVRPAGDGVTELRLSPEELGHVRIDLRTEGDRLVVAVSAERPETLDLLRRHADQLSAELRAAGQNQLDLSFGRWSGKEDGRQPVTSDAPTQESEKAPPLQPPPRAISDHIATGLYLRI